MKKINLILMMSCCWMPLLAQNWTGAVDSDWNNAANWSAAPANGGDVVINPANYTGVMASPVLATNSVFNPHEVVISNGGVLVLQSTLYTNGMVSVLGDNSMLRIDSPGFLAMTSSGLAGQLLIRSGANLEINSGNITTAGSLVVDLGGMVTSNSGVISLSEGLRLSDGDVSGSSRFYQNNGVCLIEGNLSFENTVGPFSPLFSHNGGILDVSGSLSWNGSGAGSGRGYLQASGGQITVGGGVVSQPGSTVNMNVELDGPVFFHLEGNTVTTYSGDSIVMSNGASWIDENTVSWSNGGVINATESFYTSGNSTMAGNGYFQFANLNIPSGKQLVHTTTGAPLRINGDVSVNGTFFIGTDREVIMNGSTLQLLGGSSSLIPTFYHFEVNNSGDGVVLEIMIAISNNFKLTDGIVYGSQINSIQLLNSSQIIGGSDQSFVDGYMYKTGNHAFTFPLGEGPDRYRPLTISAPSSLSTIVGASYIHDAYAQLTPVEVPMLFVSGIEYWDVSSSEPSGDFTVMVSWDEASDIGMANCDDLTLSVWDGNQWTFVASESTGLCSGSNAGTLQSVMELTDVGPVTFGFLEEPVALAENALTALTLYPNPLSADGKLHLRSDEEIVLISVYGQDGRLVISGKPETVSQGEQLFEIGAIEQGLYQVELRTKSGKKLTGKVQSSLLL